jgi:hypothetical protein
VQRANGEPKKTKKNGVIADADAAADETESVNMGDALVAIIPSETLSFYSPVIAVILSTLLKDEPSDTYMGLRWGLFAAGVVLSMALIASSKRRRVMSGLSSWPTAEMFAAGLAFAAWTLTIPGSPLLAETTEKWDAVLTILIPAATIAALGLFANNVLKTTSK